MIEQSKIDNVQPEPQPVSDMQPIATTSSPAIGNTLVVGSTVILGDCVAGMKEYPDKWFDLAVVDPPYGIGAENGYGQSNNKKIHLRNKTWDNETPTIEYFTELIRVSKHQIIFGGNYFDLPPTRGFIVWDKMQQAKNFSDCEFAWTSFDKVAKIAKVRYLEPHECNIYNTIKRIHPSQKPLKLYDWIYDKYAEPGQRVLDTHLGSGSSRIAADKYGLDFTGFEIDKEYYDLSEKRYQNYKSQLRIEGW